MDHEVSIIPRILEIFEIYVCFNFLVFWKYWKLKSPLFPGSWKYGRRAGGSFGQVFPAWVILGTLNLEVPELLDMLEIYFLCIVVIFPARAKISRRTAQKSSQDLSYETDSGSKTEPVVSHYFHIIFFVFGNMVFCLCSIPE